MKAISINTTKQVVPMIYAYTTPEIARHDGWTKIGYTEQDIDKRLKQQMHTADVEWNLEWRGNAVFDDGSGVLFRDSDFHAYLSKAGYERKDSTEWFHVSGAESKKQFDNFRSNHGILSADDTVIPYTLRDEQNDAVTMTTAYYKSHKQGEFLWNAKPRFGKTLSVYDFIKRINAQNVLIVTNRPAIANSWYEDYVHFLGDESGYKFVSSTDSLKDKPYCISREGYLEAIMTGDYYCIEFVSLQDLKGSVYFGGDYDKLREIRDIHWNVLVVDEAHEGVDTYKTDAAFDRIERDFTLHLSGTPFKALANDKFKDDAIFNWTYADEQQKKRDFVPVDPMDTNPYEKLPQLNMYTYQMSEIIRDEIDRGVEINGETEEFAFDLNEFFETKDGKFVHSKEVDKFLEALTTLEKFPFSTPELRKELKHTFWLLNRVDSAIALAKKLKAHPVFENYEIILAAGDGRLDDSEATQKSFDKVTEAIKKYDKTITLSVGQLTTGVTIPEWTAVLMLSNIKSPALYMQAAFRAQNPCMFSEGGKQWRKENAYVFDFDPARTLIIFEEFANDLSKNTSRGRGDSATRKENVRTLLNFFPVLGEDEDGEMIPLDAEKVLTIPRKIKSQEVVRRGFMSDFLFQNVANVFHAPKEVIDIISQFASVSEPKANQKINVDNNTADSLSINDEGEVEVSREHVIGTAADVFGGKIFDTKVSNDIQETVKTITENSETPTASEEKKIIEKITEQIKTNIVTPIVSQTENHYGKDLTKSDKNEIQRKLDNGAEKIATQIAVDHVIATNVIEAEREKALEEKEERHQTEQQINEYFDRKIEKAVEETNKKIVEAVTSFTEDAKQTAVKTAETNIKEREKNSIEDSIKDHLRGFSRTIPSFLMAYGDDTVNLSNFDKVIPDNVFLEVTSITLEQFRFLRDGGDYSDEETGEKMHFDGNLFDPVVFDDSVKEFMKLRVKLADYFDESSTEDIFDYIPPQKTNQIFTPKAIVKTMVDMLEVENPGCFDMPDKTFVDLYMKSGLYITEIVKRLYRSEKMKELYPDKEDRLNHIFEKQVYGLAPTEIIYRIATNYILGFTNDVSIPKHNFKQLDALPYAKAGTLSQKLDEIYK